MIVDFSQLDLSARQVLLLKNLDGTPIQPLLNVIDPEAKLNFNEISELSFTVPSRMDGIATPHYDDIVGMRIIDWVGVGQFTLNNPKTTHDGVVELKDCKAYSLEFELSYKRVYIAEGTYSLSDILSMVHENAPSWNLGNVSPKTLTRYRTFDGGTYNVYDLLKTTLQEKYSCVFEFDTYERLIHVIDADDVVEQRPVLISLQNLAKEIEVEENTEDLFTCFSVTGADDMGISSVNPMGDNLIYNLDYFMNTSYFTQEFIDKWNAWKTNLEANQQVFYMLTVDEALEWVRQTTETAKLEKLNIELTNLRTEQSAHVATNTATADNTVYQELLTQIADKETEITSQEKLVAEIEADISNLVTQKEDIVAASQFENFFTTEEDLLLLDKYIRTSDFNESSFVYREYATYDTDDISDSVDSLTIAVAEATITKIPNPLNADVEIYRGTPNASDESEASGMVTFTIPGSSENIEVSGRLTNCVLEKKADGSIVFTAELGKGAYGATVFDSGCLSVLADSATVSGDLSEDEDIGAGYMTGTELTVVASGVTLYFTQGVTEYTQRAVEWDLYEFAEAELEKAAWPKYQFSVDSANFLAAKDFEAFRKQYKLGTRVYLDLNDKVLTPIAIGAELKLHDPTSLSLVFGDEYSALDSAFQLVDLLEQSVSMGKTFSANKGAYNNFISSGSKEALYSFINEPLDLAKNAIMSSSSQAIQFDSAGLRLRKYADDAMTTYDPKQIWACHNAIVFTNDNWTTASMALGEVTFQLDGNDVTMYGLAAQALLGDMVLTNYLRVRSEKEHGGIAELQVDGDGARLYNAKFDLCNEDAAGNTGTISLNPDYGLVGGYAKTGVPLLGTDSGIYGLLTESGEVVTKISELGSDEPRANFWIDMEGNVYLRGTVYAEDGKFTGVIQAKDFVTSDGTSMLKDGKFKDTYLDLDGVYATINTTATGLEAKISDANDNYASLQASVNKLRTQVVDNSENISTIEQTATDITASVEDLQNDMSTTLHMDATGVTVVNQSGESVTISGSQIDASTINTENLNLSGCISFNNALAANKYVSQFSVNGTSDWHSEMTDDDMYRRDSYNGGTDWGTAYQFRGKNGSSASVNYDKIKTALNRADNAAMTIIDGDSIDTVDIHANNIYGGNLYGGTGSTEYYAQMNEAGFTIWQGTSIKARMYVSEDGNEVGIDLGRGTVTDGAGTWEGAGIFHLYKDDEKAYLLYNTPSNEQAGFIFYEDASGEPYIEIVGSILGVTTDSAIAVFG